jgi:hypothetical protein
MGGVAAPSSGFLFDVSLHSQNKRHIGHMITSEKVRASQLSAVVYKV